MMEPHSSEALLRTRVAVDQVRLSRLATQNAIERSRASLAETRALLVALQFAVGNREVGPTKVLSGSAATEAHRLLTTLTKIQDKAK
jgi:hypothetical protein